jgi:hypothetical protein
MSSPGSISGQLAGSQCFQNDQDFSIVYNECGPAKDDSMPVAEQSISVWRVIVLAVFGIVIGIPALFFLTLITYGVIWVPIFGLAWFAPLIVANYLLWGRYLSKDLPQEPETSHSAGMSRFLWGAFWAALALYGLYLWFEPFFTGLWAKP